MTWLRPRWGLLARLLLLVLAGVVALVAWRNVQGEDDVRSTRAAAPVTPGLIARGEYLARAGNCAACHTDRGGAAFAGGKGIATPFGTVYASNLTPDRETGIGEWTAADFWRALHHGRSRDGRLLYPAFPYPDYTLVTREDSDALYAYLSAQPAVRQRNRSHDLRFPYDTQAALAVWRAMFFTPGTFQVDAGKSPEWNRGAYLVRGLGH
jgi:mono/diheme cytochrome c family protein